MAFEKKTWVDEVTPVSAENMNRIEQGIADAAEKTDLDTHKAETASNDVHGLSKVVTGPTSAVNGNIAIFDGATGKLIKDSGTTLATNKGEATLTDTIPLGGEIKTIPIGAGKRRGKLIISEPGALPADTALILFGTYEDEAVSVYGSSIHYKSVLAGGNYTGTTNLNLVKVYINGSNLCLEFDTSLDRELNCHVRWEVW